VVADACLLAVLWARGLAARPACVHHLPSNLTCNYICVRLGHLLSMMSDLVSDLVSVRVPTCPLERAKLAMSDTLLGDRHIREVLGGSACAPPMVWYAIRITAISRALLSLQWSIDH
jgi:hypothetical protein